MGGETRVYRQDMKLTLRNLSSLAIITSGVALAFLVNSFQGAISPLFLSMLFGLLLTNTVGWRESEVMNFVAKRALRLGVILLGFQISIDQLVEIGFDGIAAVTIVVLGVFFGIRWITLRLGLSRSLATFIASGFAICGATAIAAVSSTLFKGKSETERAERERDISYAVAIVALCGTLSIFVLPAIATLLGLTDSTTGAWIGAAVHDVGQVVATAALVSDEAVESSVIVKLTRVVMLIPLVLFLARESSREHDGQDGNSKVALRKSIPVFVLLFLALAVLNNLLDFNPAIVDVGKDGSKVFLSLGLFAMGLGVKWKAISRLGSRPLIIAISLWILSAAFALGVVSLFDF
jgi:uncharacterized integral membrane protein (TIGR00698 family)